MADFSYQNLVGAPQQVAPPTLWNGLEQAPPANNAGQSLLQMMWAKQRAQQDPRVMLREINPGETWGGRDKNAIMPDNVMQNYFSPMPPEVL